jgi:hypothetical protein
MHHTAILRTLLTLACSVFVLTGCLEGESNTDGDDPPPPPSGNTAPVISGNPATAINIGSSYSFVPTASDADGDALTFSIENRPSWASFDDNTGELSGQPTLGDVGVYTNILISVSDGTDSASILRFSIRVDQVGNLSTTLTWVAPTQNEDGSALTDLAGYKIYWGTTPGQYTDSATVGAGLTTIVVENLSAGTYEFVATAINNSGVESRYSNPVTKTLN